VLIINSELKELIPPLQLEEYQLLEKSIIEEGCRDSLVIWGNTIIDGHNRYEICNRNNIEFSTKEMSFDSVREVKVWMINNQFSRRNLPLYQRAILVLKLKPIYAEQAKVNQGKRTDLSKNSSKSETVIPRDTRQELSKQSGVSEDTISRVEKIENKAPEEVKAKLRSGDISINQAYKEIVREEKRTQVKENIKIIQIPKGKFNIIYCDPPWRYDFAETSNREIENQYPTMDIEDIKGLNIPADDNSVLYMWATAPKLIEALEVMKAWGFQYKTNAVWDKEIIGMGYWFRGQHEFLLVGVKGKFSPPEQENRYSSVIREKRTKHSKKPLILYDMIEKMYPNGKYIELFSRNKYSERWEVWGNQL